MANREWGLLCPDGHGLLIERDEWTAQGVAWCPHSDHDITDGTSGRMFRRQEVPEGWFDSSKPQIKSEAILAHEAKVREADLARQEVWRMATAEKAKTKAPKEAKAPRERKAKEPKECLCGCGGMTKGGRFLPGHDARYHAAEKRKAAEAAGAEATTAPVEAAEPIEGADQPL